MPRYETRRFVRNAFVTISFACTAAAWAIALYADFCIRRMERLRVGEQRAAGGRLLEVSEHLIHYVDEGSGQTVVLIHGFGGSTFSWRKNIRPLAEAGYRVIALDLLGFGYSSRSREPVYTSTEQARMVRNFLNRLDQSDNNSTQSRRSVLIGNSLGAATALRFAADFPENTLAVIVTAPVLGFAPPWRRIRLLFRVPLVGRVVARTIYFYVLARSEASERMLRAAYGKQVTGVTSEMRAEMFRPLRVRGSADAALGLALSSEGRPLADSLDRIEAPVLVIAGGEDKVVSVASARGLYQQLSTASFEVLPEAGHLVQESRAGEFNRRVLAFLREVTDDRRGSRQ